VKNEEAITEINTVLSKIQKQFPEIAGMIYAVAWDGATTFTYGTTLDPKQAAILFREIAEKVEESVG
jgi:hypothetical protein